MFTTTAYSLPSVPYDTVGNADSSAADKFNGGYGDPTSSEQDEHSSNIGRSGRRTNGGGDGRSCGLLSVLKFVGCVGIFGGVGCTIAGCVYIGKAAVDTRGNLLGQWSDAMQTWDDAAKGLRGFKALEPFSSAFRYQFTLATDQITPADFGESSWTTKKISTPSSITSGTWTGDFECPAGSTNKPCLISISDSEGVQIVKRTVTPGQQTGPNPKNSVVNICQWYVCMPHA